MVFPRKPNHVSCNAGSIKEWYVLSWLSNNDGNVPQITMNSLQTNSHHSQNGAFYWVLVGKYEQVQFYSRSQSLLPRGKRRPRVFEDGYRNKHVPRNTISRR